MSRSLATIYDDYMSMHQNPVNRWLHVIAVAIMWSAVIAALVMGNPWLLLIVPGCYVLAFVGHYVFEKNRPAFAQHIAKRGLRNWHELIVLFAVEEVCVMRMAVQEITSIQIPRKTP